jgi:hypothetical protein
VSHAPACENCGFAGAGDGPVHPYMRSSPACWAAFGALQADETRRFGYPAVHGLIVDAYAASHGGPGDERRDRQSVAIHLIALHAVLELGHTSDQRITLLRRLTTPKRDWPHLPRPPGVPALNHRHLAGAPDAAAYANAAREWAQAVWQFWSPAHDEVRRLADAHATPSPQ